MATKAKPKADSKHGAGTRGGEMFKFEPHEFVLIGLDTTDGPEHYLYQSSVKDPPKEGLARSIAKFGVRKPVEFERDGGRILTVDGRNRIKAARLALTYMREEAEKAGEDPAKVKLYIRGIPVQGSDGFLSSIMHVANSHRRVYSPSEDAEAVQSMLNHQVDEETICVTLGLTKAQLKERKAILGLAAPVRDAIDAGRMSPTAGARLAPLPKADQVKQMNELLASGAKPTVKAAADRARAAAGKEPIETPRGKLTRIAAVLAKIASAPDETKDALVACIVNIKSIVETA